MSREKNIIKLRNKLKNKNYSIGTWMQIPNSSVAEIIGQCGYDWVAIDMEHGSFSVSQLPDIFRAIESGGSNTIPMVRLSEGSRENCKRALDAGAGGVIIPMIETAESLIKTIEFCCWPPTGKRGVGFSRANLFGKNFENYKTESQFPIIVAMIEHINGVKNINKILSVKGLDAILIGPYDLSASMGITGKFDDYEFIKILSDVERSCKEFSIPFGIHQVNPSENKLFEMINRGYTFIAYGVDAVFLNFSAKRPIKL